MGRKELTAIKGLTCLKPAPRRMPTNEMDQAGLITAGLRFRLAGSIADPIGGQKMRLMARESSWTANVASQRQQMAERALGRKRS